MIGGKEYKPIDAELGVPKEYQKNTLKAKLIRLAVRLNMGCYGVYDAQVNEQLKLRTEFPRNDWLKNFPDSEFVDIIEKILRTISKENCRVNHHYIPLDLLVYVIYDEVEDLAPALSISILIQEEFGVNYDEDYIMGKSNNLITAKDFFEEIFNIWK